LEVLIRALTALPEDTGIISVGPSTPYREECERLADELGVGERIEWRGYVVREQLLELYATCALVAVPSRYEGFGYAAAQALCVGTPVIVSDASSLPEVVAGAAPIASADDEEEWSREIAIVLADPGGANMRAYAQREAAAARFSWRASADALCGVYETALRKAQ
jgi:glycosyltransferase involved in cell wall biosynthesis